MTVLVASACSDTATRMVGETDALADQYALDTDEDALVTHGPGEVDGPGDVDDPGEVTASEIKDADDAEPATDAVQGSDGVGDADPDIAANPCDPNPCPPFAPLCADENGVAKCGCASGEPCWEPPCLPPAKPPKPQSNLHTGDLIITEVMIHPSATTDDVGEWFEVVNVSSKPIQLNGLTIADKSGADSHVINSCKSLELAPGGVFVLARSGGQSPGGGVTPGYVYGDDVALGNAGDSLYLRAVDTAAGQASSLDIDKVMWLLDWPFGDFVGHAWALDPSSHPGKAASWCWSQVPMPNGDFGSPGVINPPCP